MLLKLTKPWRKITISNKTTIINHQNSQLLHLMENKCKLTENSVILSLEFIMMVNHHNMILKLIKLHLISKMSMFWLNVTIAMTLMTFLNLLVKCLFITKLPKDKDWSFHIWLLMTKMLCTMNFSKLWELISGDLNLDSLNL